MKNQNKTKYQWLYALLFLFFVCLMLIFVRMTQAAPDTTPPTVSSTSPANGATDVAINSTITATFSERMDASTITAATFIVSVGGSQISGTVSYNNGQKKATFTPSTNLAFGTVYTAMITPAVKDESGNPMVAPYIWSFATIQETDTTPPTVSSTSPANGATDVAINSTITATFSERMDASTITTATFIVSDGGSNISGTVSYNNGQKKATFTPSTNLAFGTVYTAMITTFVKDASGNPMVAPYIWSFATIQETDTTPPTVSSTSPANGATDVAINSTITATFSERMDASTITTATFIVSDGGSNISGTVSYNNGQKKATFTPSSNLSNSTTYTAMITTGAKDLAGNTMSTNYHWGFTTVSAPDTTPPTVSSTTPANGATDVAVNSTITVTFSEAMDASTITIASFTVNVGGSNISGTVSYSGTTATFTPSSNLSNSTTYTAIITTGAKDLAGNAIASPYTWSFSTVSVPGPGEPPPTEKFTINSTNPSNGDTNVAINTLVYTIFSMYINGSTLTTDTFKLSGGGNEVAGSVTTNGATAIFTPSTNLFYNTTYTATITTKAQAANFAGTTLDSDYTWSFTTVPDTIPPTIISTSPVNGATNVDINSSITVTFSEEMNASTITTDTFNLSTGSNIISGTVSYGGTTATFTPSSPLANSTTYTIEIETDVKDLAGNALASHYHSSFTTEPTPAITPTATPTPTPTPTPTSSLYLSKEMAYLYGDTIVATVVDTDRNISSTSADILTTALKVTGSNYSVGTDLLLDLNEDGINSGTFLATITTGTVTTGGASASIRANSGTIKATQGGTATVIYTDTTPYASLLMKTLTFSSFDATLSFNADAYSVGSYTEITLADAERNTSHTEAESLLNDVSIETSSVNSTKVKMVETGADTGTFTGSIQVVTSGGTLEFERIQATVGDTLKITYLDEINTTGFPKTVSDTASVKASVTPTPTATPTITPTPSPCNAKSITVSPRKLKLKKDKGDAVTVTLTGDGDCLVEGETVKAEVIKGKRLISVSPASAITNTDGQTGFTITASKKTGNAKVKFKSGNVRAIVKVKVVK